MSLEKLEKNNLRWELANVSHRLRLLLNQLHVRECELKPLLRLQIEELRAKRDQLLIKLQNYNG